MVRPARVQADHRDPGALADCDTGSWFSGGWSSSPSTRTSGCWRSPSTSGGGRRSPGTSGRSGRCGSGCWTGWRIGGSGSTRGRPEPQSVGQLADEVTRDADMMSVLALWEGRPDVPVTESLEKLLADEAVPFLAAYRYKDSGLRKREAWEETWALQRREDRGEKVGHDPGAARSTRRPTSASRPTGGRAASWTCRRSGSSSTRTRTGEDDPTPLLGWAGWDHARAVAGSVADHRGAGAGGLGRRAAGSARRRAGRVAAVGGAVAFRGRSERYGVSLAAFCREQLDAAGRPGREDAERSWRRGARPRPAGAASAT